MFLLALRRTYVSTSDSSVSFQQQILPLLSNTRRSYTKRYLRYWGMPVTSFGHLIVTFAHFKGFSNDTWHSGCVHFTQNIFCFSLRNLLETAVAWNWLSLPGWVAWWTTTTLGVAEGSFVSVIRTLMFWQRLRWEMSLVTSWLGAPGIH